MSDCVNFNEKILINKIKDLINKKNLALSQKSINDDTIVFAELAGTSINKTKSSLQNYELYLQKIRAIIDSNDISSIEGLLKNNKEVKELSDSFSSCEKLLDMAINYFKNNIKIEEKVEEKTKGEK